MIRFYKSYLGRMFLGLLILIELEKTSGKPAVMDAVTRWQPPDPNVALVVQNLLDGYLNSEPETDDVIKGALGQLTKKRHEDADLLDTIINVLRLPFTNYFTGKTLQVLRDAVLTPGELTDLKKAYKTAAACACGHVFTQGEMVSATAQYEAITLKCTKCRRPDFGRCDYCGNVVQLMGTNAKNALKEIDCGCRKKAERSAKLGIIAADSNSPTAQLLAEQARLTRSVCRAQTTFYTAGHVPKPTPLSPYQDVFAGGVPPPLLDDDAGEIW